MKVLLPMPELQNYLHAIYPQTKSRFTVQRLEEGTLEMLMHMTENDVRPGGTISGPSIFMLVDCAFYALTLSLIGKEALAVTTNININFVRKATQKELLCHTRMLKFGKQLCVGDALVYSDELLIAQASITYAIPPNRMKK
jgi:uncharacterized protein (TIGR00369 family)